MEYLSNNNSYDEKTGFTSSVNISTIGTIGVSLKFKSDVIEFTKPKITAY